MTVKKLLALSLVFVMALAMTACGEKDADTTTVPTTETTTEAVTSETTTAADETTTEAVVESTDAEAETSATEAATETTEAGKPDLKTTEGIVNFYKDAAVKTEKAGVKSNVSMSLVSLDGGEGFIGGLISAFEPIARKALSNNSTPTDGIVGSASKLTASDVKSAKATDNGKTTTVTIVLKEQTDGKSGNKNGTVAHGIGVLDGIDTAIGELDGVTIDYSQGVAQLKYANPTIKVTIDNATGKITSGTWHYEVQVTLDNIGVKLSIFDMTLKGAYGVIDYTVTL